MFGERATNGDRSQLDFLRNEVVRLEAMAESGKQARQKKIEEEDEAEDKGSEHESEEDVRIYLDVSNCFALRMKMTT